MRISKIIFSSIVMSSLLGMPSCAHQSGHRPRAEQQRMTSAGSDKTVSDNNIKRASEQHPKKAISAPDLKLPPSSPKGERMDGSEIFDRYNTAVFMVYTSDGINGYQGSGFFLNSNGLAVSNYHVFQGTSKGAEMIKLSGSDDVWKVTDVIHSDEEEDFIIFKVNISNTNYIPLAENRPKVGSKVFAIGSPRGLENTFSSGEVSQWRDLNLMQISALIDHGSSGGALINEYGEAVGITSGSFYDGSQANLNYAWSVEAIKPYLN